MKQGIKITACLLACLGVQLDFTEHAQATSAERQYESLKTQPMKNNPDALPSDAIKQQGMPNSSNMLQTETDSDAKRKKAAGMFIGFYLINTQTRPDYCKQFGIDIQGFVTQFKNGHAAELAKARHVLKLKNEDAIYAATKPQMEKLIVLDMQDIASHQKTDMKGACQILADRGEDVAKMMHISNTQPLVYEALK